MPTTITFHPNQAGLNQLLKSPGGEVGRYIIMLGHRTATAAKGNAPVKTGALKASIGVTDINQTGFGTEVIVAANIEYGFAVHEGQPPKTVLPNKAQVLRFPDKAGVMIFRPKSDQGKTKANPFLWDALVSVVH